MDSLVVVEGAEDSGGADAMDFSLEKKSPAKETSKKINLEVNSKLIFDYKKMFT